MSTIVVNSLYFSCQLCASLLKFRLCFPCLRSSANAMSNARPKRPLNPALMAISFLDDGAVGVEDELDAVTVAVAMTVVVAETVSVLLGDVEPDVRL